MTVKADIARDFIKERDEAILSLDRGKIEEYLKKYHVPIPQDDEVFWRGVHKVVCAIKGAPESTKKASEAWLHEHGSSPALD